MKRPSQREIMIGASAFLALAIPTVLLWPSAVPETPVTAMHLTRLVSPAMLALRGAALDAPLFAPERERPAEAGTEVADASMPVAPPTPPMLVGTIAGIGHSSLALIKSASGETTTVNVGDEVDGWRLLAIGNGTATLEQGGDRQTIALNFSNKEGSAATAQAPTGATPPAPIAAQPAVFQQPMNQARAGTISQ